MAEKVEKVEKVEKTLKIVEGNVVSHTIVKREGADLHKLTLDTEENTEYSYFGLLEIQENDYIKFEYYESGWYKTIKNILEIKKLNQKASQEEVKLVIDRINYRELEPLCMELAFRFGIQKGYELDEILALYARLLNILNKKDKKEVID